MAFLFMSEADDAEDWRQLIANHMPGEEFRVGPDAPGDPADVEFLLVWRPPPGSMKGYPNLKAVLNLGAGVDGVLKDPDLPDVPLVRLIDDGLAQGMAEYVTHAVLHFHRDMHRYREFQAKAEWTQIPQVDAHNRRVGILGMGHLGRTCARALLPFGFPVNGWSRAPKEVEGVEGFDGPDGLEAFLALSDIVVCLLPLTTETRGLLNKDVFALMPEQSYLVNAARGPVVVAEDLIAALDSGHLAGAFLDVFAKEPMPASDPLWKHPKIVVTPHIAAITLPRPAAKEVVANIKRIRKGETPIGLVDRERGY